VSDLVEAWARIRYDDLVRREGRHSFAVGPNKPLGGQGFPKDTAQSLRTMAFPDRLFDVLLASGEYTVPSDRTRIYRRKWSNSPAGTWLYVWDEAALQSLLDRTAYPKSTSDFVEEVRETLARPLTPAFDRIADAYGDATSAGRTDVLPGVPRRQLLDAFTRVHGFQDEGSWFYLHKAGMLS